MIDLREKKHIALIRVREKKPIALIHVREKKHIALIHIREKGILMDVLRQSGDNSVTYYKNKNITSGSKDTIMCLGKFFIFFLMSEEELYRPSD